MESIKTNYKVLLIRHLSILFLAFSLFYYFTHPSSIWKALKFSLGLIFGCCTNPTF